MCRVGVRLREPRCDCTLNRAVSCEHASRPTLRRWSQCHYQMSETSTRHSSQGPPRATTMTPPPKLHELRESVSTPSKCTVHTYRRVHLSCATSTTPMSTRREAERCRMRPR